MKTKSILFLSLLACCFSACSSDDNSSNGNGGTTTEVNENKNVAGGTIPEEVTRMEFPKVELNTSTNDTILVRKTDDFGVTYCTNYSLGKKAVRWCCYAVYKDNNFKNWTRSSWKGATWMGKTWTGDPFQKDPSVASDAQPPVTNEFSKSGYDRGHIVASEDRIYSQDANGQTFFMTNMYPQLNAFNTGIWEKMEEQVRAFLSYDTSKDAAHANDTLYVCKGGTIDNEDEIYGRTNNGYIVPKYFWCAVLLKNSKGYQAIGFWFEHKADYKIKTLSSYAVNIDKLEKLTGLDFFCNLPDDVENRIEASAYDPNTLSAKWGF